MPSIIILMGVLSLVGFSTMAAVSTSQLAAIKQTYLQIAHIGSKAAFDLAKEEYEADPDYNGTPEQDLIVTDRYRTTIQVEVLSTSGNTKSIRATGRVYIPQTSSTASFVRDIKGGIVRDGITIGSPSDYNPILWLDASEDNSLLKSTAGSNTQTISPTYGSGSANIVEQRGSDASSSAGSLDFSGDDLEMSWDGSTRGTQVVGLRFPGVNIPQGATITTAYIQFRTDETKQAGTISFDIEGVDVDNASTWSGNSAVSNATKTSAKVDWTPVDWNVVGAQGANERTNSLVSIVQEIVSRPGWNNGNAMAFSVKADSLYTGSGHGIRTAEKGSNGSQPVLHLAWDTASLEAGNSENVVQWLDRSGNNRHANQASSIGGAAPTRIDGQLNGLPIVRFRDETDSLLLSSFGNLSGDGLTALMVIRPLTSTPDGGRFLSAMRSSQSEDTNTSNGSALFYKSNTTGSNSMRNYYNNAGAEYVSGAVDDNWAIYSMRLSDDYVERLRKNGLDNYNETHTSVNYSIGQIYIGGRRSNTSLANLSDADIAEVIVYDSSLQCSEIYPIELYLADKWDIDLHGSAGCS